LDSHRRYHPPRFRVQRLGRGTFHAPFLEFTHVLFNTSHRLIVHKLIDLHQPPPISFLCLLLAGAYMCEPTASHHAGGRRSCSCSCLQRALQRIPVPQQGSTVETDHRATRRLLCPESSASLCSGEREKTWKSPWTD
jgi:hypothetical protein